MSDLLCEKVLGLVIVQETLCEGLILGSEFVNVVDLVRGQPLGGGVVFDQKLVCYGDGLA